MLISLPSRAVIFSACSVSFSLFSSNTSSVESCSVQSMAKLLFSNETDFLPKNSDIDPSFIYWSIIFIYHLVKYCIDPIPLVNGEYSTWLSSREDCRKNGEAVVESKEESNESSRNPFFLCSFTLLFPDKLTFLNRFDKLLEGVSEE